MSFKRPNSATCAWVYTMNGCQSAERSQRKRTQHTTKISTLTFAQLPTAELQRNKMIRIERNTHVRKSIYVIYVLKGWIDMAIQWIGIPHTHHTPFTTHYPLLLPVPLALFCYCFIFLFQYMLSYFGGYFIINSRSFGFMFFVLWTPYPVPYTPFTATIQRPKITNVMHEKSVISTYEFCIWSLGACLLVVLKFSLSSSSPSSSWH